MQDEDEQASRKTLSFLIDNPAKTLSFLRETPAAGRADTKAGGGGLEGSTKGEGRHQWRGRCPGEEVVMAQGRGRGRGGGHRREEVGEVGEVGGARV